MKLHVKKFAFIALAGSLVFAYSCSKTSSGGNNNNNNNNNTPGAPKLTVVYPGQDTTVGDNPIPVLTVTLKAIAGDTSKIDSILGNDGLGHHARYIVNGLKNGNHSRTLDSTFYDYYTAPTSAIGSTVTLTYTVYDSKKSSTTVTRKIKVTSVPVFALYTVILGDQNQNGNGAFLNTGANPKAVVYSTGQVNADTSLRRLVDMCVAQTKGETDMLFSPGYVNNNTGSPSKTFSDSNIFNINSGWLVSQRRTTMFRLLAPKYICNASTYPDYAHVVAAYKASTAVTWPRVQSILSPNDNYAFLTEDGRYGAFTVVAIGGGIKMTMAIESK